MTETPKPGPTIKFANGTVVDITDPHNIIPVQADIISEIRIANGALYLSLASLIVDGADTVKGEARVCARLRITDSCLQLLRGFLDKPETPIHAGPDSVN